MGLLFTTFISFYHSVAPMGLFCVSPISYKCIMENIIIALIFLSAIFYLGNLVRKNFSLKNKAGCSKGCGSCGAIDFDSITVKGER